MREKDKESAQGRLELSAYDFVQFSSLANPAFPEEEFYRAQREMPEWRFRMFYLGEPARPAGLIYSDFDASVHWCAPFPIPDGSDPQKPAWEHYLGVDPGGANTGLLWVAREPETGLCYVYRELHTGGLSTPTLVEKANSYEALKAVWGGAVGETQFRRDWSVAGLHVQTPVVADVEQGIDRVAAAFKNNRLFVFNTCHHLRDQLATYSRDVDDAGETTDRIKNKERYHLLDALRYVVSGITRPPFKQWASSHYSLA